MTLYAENLNYWQTSRTAPDGWIEKAKREIVRAGGKVLAEGFGSEEDTGRAAYMLAFRLEEQTFRVTWPVLPSRAGKARAARIQAATMLYHHVKAACLASKVLGARTAFFAWLVLPDGRTAAQAADGELMVQVPQMLTTPVVVVLPDGETVA